MNPLYATTKEGTIGELLVQLHLLQYNVQSAPPIKDSGNDLIAICGKVFRAVQVRTTTVEAIDKPGNTVLYHVLAIVQLPSINGRFIVNSAQIYLFSQDEVKGLSGKVSCYHDNLLSEDLIHRLFDHHAT